MIRMSTKPVVRKPNVYITPDLIEGEKCAIHIIAEKQTFLTLKFEEGDPEVPFKPFLSADNALDLEVKPKVKKIISQLEDRIVDCGVVYTCYNYLLTVRDNEVFLLSTSLGGISLGFDITKGIAEKIKIPTYNSVFQGLHTNHTSSVFVEDIFIQKQ